MHSVLDESRENPPATRPAVVETLHLEKHYRTGFWFEKKVESLKSCTLSVYEGETFGLLGPNGAGKTTLLKTLLGIARPTGGRAMILGKPIGDRSVRQRIGYLPENAYYYDYLTGWEFLDLIGGIFEIPASVRRKRIAELLDRVGLDRGAAKKKQLRQYSKGMVQRVGMAQALINDPEIVFLDEPMSGLDPLGRYQVREIIHSLKKEGKTIFFNSHILSDVEQICDRVALLARGELLCMGSLDELLGRSDVYQVTVQGGSENQLREWIAGLTWGDGFWHGQLKGEPEPFIVAIGEMGIRLIGLDLARASLEEFFIRQLRERGITASQ
ncbi:ABC transporter ATP-binding protein [Pannus brasiliensis CCIBt3594]|uniref:ABC transporter ATP-binding protein n=1 Tax=Pannus brasiliensis CCIBt3594 TaxID=1427578 RepID=A0AAW9QSE2_9CHRO